MFRYALMFIGALVVGVVGGTVLQPLGAESVDQPIDFNHKVHTKRINCRECHFRCEKNRDEDDDLDCEDCEEADTPFCAEHAACPDHKLPDMPGIRVCVKCHEEDLVELNGKQPSEDEPGDAKKRRLLDYVNIDDSDEIAITGEIVWKRITKITTSNINFSHRRHAQIAAIACNNCHGDIGSSEHPPRAPAVAVRMQWCLDCHHKPVAGGEGVPDKRMEACLSCHR